MKNIPQPNRQQQLAILKEALEHTQRFAPENWARARAAERMRDLEDIHCLLKSKNGRPGCVPIDIDGKIQSLALRTVSDFPSTSDFLGAEHRGRGLLAEMREQRVLSRRTQILLNVHNVIDATRPSPALHKLRTIT